MRRLLVLLGAVVMAAMPAATADYTAEREALAAGRRADARLEWWGFHPEDGTDAMRQALASGAKTLVVSRQAGPWILAEPVALPSDFELIFEPGAELRAKRGAFQGGNDSLIFIRNAKNVTLRGPGLLSMHRSDYQDKARYTPAEWRHCLAVFNSSGVHIDGLTLAESGGDGIYLNRAKDTIIENVVCRDNHRQGLSVIAAENLLIRDSVFSGTRGAAPEAGIDFEPNREDEPLVNCRVERCRFVDNASDGILVYLPSYRADSEPFDIAFVDCVVENNRGGATVVTAPGPGESGRITFENCQIRGAKEYSIALSGHLAAVTLRDTVIDNNGAKDRAAIRISGRQSTGVLGNLHAENVTVLDKRPGAEAVAFTGWKLYPLESMTGGVMLGAKTYRLEDMAARSLAEKPLAAAVADFERLMPRGGSKGGKGGGEPPWRMRFGGVFVQYAEAGEPIAFQVEAIPLGAAPQSVTLRAEAPSGKAAGSWTVEHGQQPETIRLTPEETGVYRLFFHSAGTVRIASDRPGNGYWTHPSVRGFRSTGTLYFLVPAGEEEVAVRVAGDNADEWVSATLLDAGGKALARAERVGDAQLLFHKRTNAARDAVYALRVDACVEDFNISLMGGALPFFSTSPESLLCRR